MFQKSRKPSLIDLIQLSSTYKFQSCCAIETGLSDFHKIFVTAMKSTFQKLKPKIVNYRDC